MSDIFGRRTDFERAELKANRHSATKKFFLHRVQFTKNGHQNGGYVETTFYAACQRFRVRLFPPTKE